MNNIIKNTFLFLLLAGLPVLVTAQFTETKEISKRYKVTRETRIEITNKYGKIELNPWDKDSVVFLINIRVEDKKLSKLEKAIDEIDFDITNSQHFLIFRTKVGENLTSLEKELQRFKETILQADGKMEINFRVWLPKNNPLKVENKFGDIYIGDYQGDVDIQLSNGNLKSHDFFGKTNLTLNFADATINEMKSGRLDCSYSDVYLKKADKLRVVSKSSDFEITELKELSADSRRDKFRIRYMDLLDAKGSFSNFRINEITDRVTLRAEYGNLEIDNTAADFSSVFIEAKSTDINLSFNEKSKFQFEITHTKASTNFCREIKIKKEQVLDEKEKKLKINGVYGGESTGTKLVITATSGEINIRTN